ncbi:MAG TPA: polyketide antibiotic transporter, partial [Microbacteriaceae bacterium]|nr:polyketide antibiotic transporter [Microbacteriaceae bacterium]
FATNTLWPLALCLGVAIALGAAAILLQAARDTGESLIPAREGRASARGSLRSPTALVWRLTWGSLLGWSIGGLLTGLLATSLASVINSVTAQIPAVQALFEALSKGGSLAQGMVAIFFMIVGLLAACAGVQTICRARQEEVHGTAELVLATPVERVRWLGGYLVVAATAIVLVAASGVLGAVLGVAATGTDWSLVRDALVTGGAQALAAAVFVAITALLFVLLPHTTIPAGWSLVMLGALLGLFGALFNLPEWIVNLSPLAAAPTVVQDAIDAKGMWWLVAAAGVGAVASMLLMRRRELAARS